MADPLESQRHLFDVPDDVTYLNCAYISPKPHPVREAGLRAIVDSASPWNVTANDFFEPVEELRSAFAHLVGGDADGVAVVPSASYGSGVAAANIDLAPGRTIVMAPEEFPSDVYPWRAVVADRGGSIVIAPEAGSGDWTDPIISSIDERTAAVMVPPCHWTDGRAFDLAAIGEATRSVGAALVIDLSQSLGVVPFDVKAIRPDFLIAVGYKWLMGPYSLGYLWVSERYRDSGRSIEQTWQGRKGSDDFARLVDYTDELRSGARRFDMGEAANFNLLPMAKAALDLISLWGPDRVEATLAPLTTRIEEGTRELGLDPVPAAHRFGHLIGVRFPKGLPDGIRDRLAAEKVYASVRGSAVRVSPHLYNDEADADRFLAVLQGVL